MEKYIFDQNNSLWYELQGDYYIPCLVLDEAGTSPIGMCIGMWGRKHQQYLKEHRPMLYSDLVLSGKLHSYLADIDTQARNKLHLLITQLAEKEGINEQLKAQDQMAWVGATTGNSNLFQSTKLPAKEKIPCIGSPSTLIGKCLLISSIISCCAWIQS